MRIGRAIIAAVLMTASASAQQSGVVLVLEAHVLEVGESVDGKIVCTNTGRPSAPRISAPAGLELRVVNPIPSQSSMISIVNGRRTRRETFTYTLRLTATKPGTYVIDPIVVEAGGANYQTNAMRITVRASASASKPDGDRLVFVHVQVEPTSVYVTESIQASLTIGIRKIYINGEVVEYDNLLRSVDSRGSNLSVFGKRFDARETFLLDSQGRRHRYILYRISTEIRTEQVGELLVGPIFLRVNYPLSLRRSFWGRGYEPDRTKRVTARADAVRVDVKGAPEDGRPDDFTGAIGRYALVVSAKPTRVVQGRPVTLTVEIRGTPVEGIAGPDLTRQAELVSRFDFTTDELTGDVERNNVKVFRRAIFPKQQGEQTIPTLSWSYFDPTLERYTTLTSKPIALTVDPPAAGSLATVTFQDSTGDAEDEGLTILRGGIAPSYIDPEAVLATQSFEPTRVQTVATLTLPPLLCLIINLTSRHRSRLRADMGFARRRKALRAGRTQLTRALGQKDTALQMQGIADALTLYLSHRFDLPPGEFTPVEVRNLLTARGVDAETAASMSTFLADCDAIRFAPSAPGTCSPKQAAGSVRGWMAMIERGTR
ncbi:MAG: BatD family protein [Planctomycetes bacterium]|nr:BatD family protein [Planctomycetota bacterium]